MTRARARTIETEVNSFLFEIHSDSHVSQILPQMETLCILRYFGDRHEKARRDHQVHRRPTEEEKEDGRAAREKKEESWTPRVPGHFGPGGPARPVAPLPVGPGCPAMEGPSARTPLGAAPAGPGCPALEPRVPGVGVKTGGSRVGGPDLCV